MEKLSCKLTIFEGPDGGGKSTTARVFAEATGAKYVHFPALHHMRDGLARVYVEAMLPALLGHQDVVFDRCWLSEAPYGVAFRGGRNRVTAASIAMLERLAMRCGAVVVRCQPPWDVVKANYLSRKNDEMLDSAEQLEVVYKIYANQSTDLPTVDYDYTREDLFGTDALVGVVENVRMPRHPVGLVSAGNWAGRVIFVGASLPERKDCDPWYQWPFASFSSEGTSQWLTTGLCLSGVHENQILWVDVDQDLSLLYDVAPSRLIIAMGSRAYQQLYKLKITPVVVQHPDAWTDFGGRPYQLFGLI